MIDWLHVQFLASLIACQIVQLNFHYNDYRALRCKFQHEDLYRVIDWECVLEFMVFYKKLHTLELDDQPCIKDLTKCQACPAPEEVHFWFKIFDFIHGYLII